MRGVESQLEEPARRCQVPEGKKASLDSGALDCLLLHTALIG